MNKQILLLPAAPVLLCLPSVELSYCQCGCGSKIIQGKKFVKYHKKCGISNAKGKKWRTKNEIAMKYVFDRLQGIQQKAHDFNRGMNAFDFMGSNLYKLDRW